MSDPDVRVKVKAIDILGAREANDAVTPMSTMLFLRSTEPIVKLHLVAALGRIGDAQGALPVMQYLGEDQDERGRGTAVFALGEIGSDKAVPLLNAVVAQDQSPMVRRLAKEALEKVSGEMPTERAKTVASNTAKTTSRPIRNSPSCARWTRRCPTWSADSDPSPVISRERLGARSAAAGARSLHAGIRVIPARSTRLPSRRRRTTCRSRLPRCR